MTLIDEQVPSVTSPSWIRVCALDALETERGRAALVHGIQIALFLLADGRVHAVQNLDPYSGAHVISRGIVGTRQEAPTVASPMYKQVFDLRTGMCLDTQGKDPAALRVWPTAVSDGDVLVRWS
ncbi:nitrite reductase small subunit NirD [Microbacterium invictum]|uniref:Nitrite reductase (NADH) small subunit n=1 Tax=Microbacterium invictum TaxID=515415 RepID=A0AA40SMI7_9MICO|nr:MULTISPECIES: nitrite reductase small subunit NirD [Microbacterium]MBB4138953.1 nitrite reductase (NADH) small subunit [Microbacterium invictum]